MYIIFTTNAGLYCFNMLLLLFLCLKILQVDNAQANKGRDSISQSSYSFHMSENQVSSLTRFLPGGDQVYETAEPFYKEATEQLLTDHGQDQSLIEMAEPTDSNRLKQSQHHSRADLQEGVNISDEIINAFYDTN